MTRFLPHIKFGQYWENEFFPKEKKRALPAFYIHKA